MNYIKIFIVIFLILSCNFTAMCESSNIYKPIYRDLASRANYDKGARETLESYLLKASPSEFMEILECCDEISSESTIQILSGFLKINEYVKAHFMIGKSFGSSIEVCREPKESEPAIFSVLKDTKNKNAVLGFLDGLDDNLSFYNENSEKRIKYIIEELRNLSRLFDEGTNEAILLKIDTLEKKWVDKRNKEIQMYIMILKMSLSGIEISYVADSLRPTQINSETYALEFDEVIQTLEIYFIQLEALAGADDINVKDLKKQISNIKKKHEILIQKDQSEEAKLKADQIIKELKEKYDQPERLVGYDELDYVRAYVFQNQIIISGAWEAGYSTVLERAEHYFDAEKCYVKLYRKPYFNSRGDTNRIFIVSISCGDQLPIPTVVYLQHIENVGEEKEHERLGSIYRELTELHINKIETERENRFGNHVVSTKIDNLN